MANEIRYYTKSSPSSRPRRTSTSRRPAGPPAGGGGGHAGPMIIVVAAAALAVGVVLGALLFGRGSGRPNDVADRTPAAAASPGAFAHTAQGAVAAVTAYTGMFRAPLVFDETKLRAELGKVIDAESAPDLIERMAQGLAVIDRGTGLLTAGRNGVPVVVQGFPLTYHLDSYAADRARVRLWGLSLIGGTDQWPIEENWQVNTVDLLWRGGWKVAGVHAEGVPAPHQGVGQTTMSGIPEFLQSFQGYRYAPSS